MQDDVTARTGLIAHNNYYTQVLQKHSFVFSFLLHRPQLTHHNVYTIITEPFIDILPFPLAIYTIHRLTHWPVTVNIFSAHFSLTLCKSQIGDHVLVPPLTHLFWPCKAPNLKSTRSLMKIYDLWIQLPSNLIDVSYQPTIHYFDDFYLVHLLVSHRKGITTFCGRYLYASRGITTRLIGGLNSPE